MSRLFAWMLNLAYLATLLIASPMLLWAASRHGKYREGFAAKFLGRVPLRQGRGPCLWLHAVSVGEVNLLATTIAEFAARELDWEIVISTTTKTGYELACRKYAERTVFYCPLDFSWAVANAMRRVRPAILVLAELELWPNLIAAAKQHGAKVAIINGRLSDRSFRGYRRVRPLVARVLRQFDLIAAQNRETADRFVELGATSDVVHATGSLKFDGAQTDRNNRRTLSLKELAGIKPDDVVLLAGSTQEPEEQFAVDIFKRLSSHHPRLRVVLVPRHPQRFDEVAAMLDRNGVAWQRRSALPTLQPRALPGGGAPVDAASGNPRPEAEAAARRWSVLLVDTIGELGAWWGAAAIGFVGGSFGSRGGQNMLEPAAYGVATCFGPNTWNFRDIVAQLHLADGARVVRTAEEFEAFVRWALENPAEAQALGQRACQRVQSQQGATLRTVDFLMKLIDQPKAVVRDAA